MKQQRDRGRITQPLVRDSGALRPATWDEALDRAAPRASGACATPGAAAPSGMFSCSKATNEVNYLAQKMMRIAMGSNHIDSCNRT
jgi:predicted molibdopterin-dependent oxidoreductase YjgC